MNSYYIKLNGKLFLTLAITIAIVFSTSLSLGQFKPDHEIEWLDIAGEGGITLMTLIWIFFTLASRPSGLVTYLLFTGLTLTHVSMLLDFLDEFIHYPVNSAWLTTIESLPAPFGMVLMTLGLYYWHQEQMTFNKQLRRSERYYREHSLNDFVTNLYSAEYMKKQLQHELNHIRIHQGQFCLALFDIKNFTAFNREHGFQQGDNLLREIAQLILMNIRDGDLACRYASDRFIVLMPNTDEQTANEIADQVSEAIAHLAFKVGDSSHAYYAKVISCVEQYRTWHNYQHILADLNQQLMLNKQAQQCA